MSSPISRWLTMQPRSWWTNSIGSSIVTMCCLRPRFILSIIAASVVDLPEPVAPVTRTRPRCSSARRSTPPGRPSCWRVGTEAGMKRKERDRAPLAEGVDAEAAELVGHVGGVEVAGGQEVLPLAGVRSVIFTRTASRSLSVRARSSIGTRSPSIRPMGGADLQMQVFPPRSTTRAKNSSSFMPLLAYRRGRMGPRR